MPCMFVVTEADSIEVQEYGKNGISASQRKLSSSILVCRLRDEQSLAGRREKGSKHNPKFAVVCGPLFHAFYCGGSGFGVFRAVDHRARPDQNLSNHRWLGGKRAIWPNKCSRLFEI